MDMEGYKGLIFHESLESFKTKVAMYFLRNRNVFFEESLLTW